eukprot:scpid83103/ scgid23168/ 
MEGKQQQEGASSVFVIEICEDPVPPPLPPRRRARQPSALVAAAVCAGSPPPPPLPPRRPALPPRDYPTSGRAAAAEMRANQAPGKAVATTSSAVSDADYTPMDYTPMRRHGGKTGAVQDTDYTPMHSTVMRRKVRRPRAPRMQPIKEGVVMTTEVPCVPTAEALQAVAPHGTRAMQRVMKLPPSTVTLERRPLEWPEFKPSYFEEVARTREFEAAHQQGSASEAGAAGDAGPVQGKKKKKSRIAKFFEW